MAQGTYLFIMWECDSLGIIIKLLQIMINEKILDCFLSFKMGPLLPSIQMLRYKPERIVKLGLYLTFNPKTILKLAKSTAK